MVLIDYHIHSLYSADSKASIEYISRVAHNKGINEIAITDHFEPTLLDEEYKDYDPRGQRIELDIFRERYENKLTILQGIEIGQPHHFEEEIKRVLSKVNYDYVIGSAHKNAGGIDVGCLDYKYSTIDDIIKYYLNELKLLALNNSFDCIGHLDLIRRYGFRRNISFSMASYKDELAEIFEILIRNDKGIEINTSGVRGDLHAFMPEYDIVKFYKECGGKIVTVGSDAHEVVHVGSDIELAYEMLRAAGFKEITTYRNRIPRFMPLQARNIYSTVAM